MTPGPDDFLLFCNITRCCYGSLEVALSSICTDTYSVFEDFIIKFIGWYGYGRSKPKHGEIYARNNW